MAEARGTSPHPRAWRFNATLAPAAGVAAIPYLEAFLPECGRVVRSFRPTGDVDSVAGWGLKPTSRYARFVAEANGWPYLALEDGFLRSVGLGEAGAPPMSLVVDDEGIYYDARKPSRLESLLQAGDGESEALLARARSSIATIVAAGLSKTNAAPRLDPDRLQRTTRRRVLVIDQTAGDASIQGGLANDATFEAMLAAARRDEPGAEIVVRRHPAVAAGLKRGCLPLSALAGTTVVDEPCRVTDLLDRADAVYTVSSLTGFEALLRGLPVRCFGLPFYAGWGATRDEIASPRRRRRLTVEQIFAAAYLQYARYIDPLTGEPATAERAIERLIDFRERSERHAGFTACLGFAPWKRGSARTLLYSPRGEVGFFVRPERAAQAAEARSGRVVFWAGRETPRTAAKLARSRAPVLRMEDGFIRSRGLGSDFHRAASVILDDLGVYYDSTRPSRLEVTLQSGGFADDILARADRLRRTLIEQGLSKYNLGGEDLAYMKWPQGRFKLLVVGQVENDKSILMGCDNVRTNLGLLKEARAAHPDSFLVYKPHPDVEAGNRPGAIGEKDTLHFADAIVRRSDVDACLRAVDGVATMTSLAGFEALMRGREVWTFGRPFFAGWGLTHDALDFPRRTRRLTLAELVAGALILYPLYVDPNSGLPCDVERVVTVLAADRGVARSPLGGRRVRYFRAVVESLRTGSRARF